MTPARNVYAIAWERFRRLNRVVTSCTTFLIVRCEYASRWAISRGVTSLGDELQHFDLSLGEAGEERGIRPVPLQSADLVEEGAPGDPRDGAFPARGGADRRRQAVAARFAPSHQSRNAGLGRRQHARVVEPRDPQG